MDLLETKLKRKPDDVQKKQFEKQQEWLKKQRKEELNESRELESEDKRNRTRNSSVVG